LPERGSATAEWRNGKQHGGATVERVVTDARARWTPRELERRVAELGPWFHDIELAHGVRTAPDHPLGDFLQEIWRQVSRYVPADLSGQTVLDIGCNAGFYAQQLRRRGARVVGIDHDEHYLRQARFAAEVNGLDIEYRLLDTYDVEELDGEFDYVLFMGVLYHLRYPLYALDRVARLPRRRLIVQSMIRGVGGTYRVPEDAPITERQMFEHPRFPAMYFIENRYAGDPTNWWVPNEAGMEAMLRSAGLRIVEHPFTEMWVCEPAHGVGGSA
jgi:tRNA (mo5U34)-methyltransferase